MGLVLISPKKITLKKSLRLGFSTTNNEAKYEALLDGMGARIVEIFFDSRLVVG